MGCQFFGNPLYLYGEESMTIILIALVAFGASLLTFFSGFGLGTLLMPVIALFFPLPVAIAITAIVHFSNNLFKFSLLAKHTNIPILIKFGIPAMVAAFIGAICLDYISLLNPWISYTLLGHLFEITPIKLTVGSVILIFLFLESQSKLTILSTPSTQSLFLGGVLSGFFGGLSGNQGAFRSMFLANSLLSKESFLATGVTLAVIVDFSRITLYGHYFTDASAQLPLIITAIVSAFIGTLIGNKYFKKMSIEILQKIVSFMLILIAILLITGIL